MNGASTNCGCVRKSSVRHVGKSNRKTGKWMSNGYIMVTLPPDVGGKRKSKPEHRMIMEKIIGRDLRPEETIHHKNGIRSDNRPENLELWASRHKPGQRVSDLVEYSEQILALYAPEKLNNPIQKNCIQDLWNKTYSTILETQIAAAGT